MRDMSFRHTAMLIATVALSGSVVSARAANFTTMLPNGQRVVITQDGGATPASPTPPPAAPAPPAVAATPPAAAAALPPAPAAVPPGPAAAGPAVAGPTVAEPPAMPPAATGQDAAATQAVAAVQSSDPAVPPTLNPLSALAKTSFVAFIEKPLFDPTRRLPPPIPVVQEVARVVAPPPPPPEEPPNLHLIGVIQGDRNIAVVHRGDDTKTELLSNGDTVDGWQVIVPPSLGLQLKKGDRVVDLKMFNVTAPTPGTTVAQFDPDAIAVQAQARARQARGERQRPRF